MRGSNEGRILEGQIMGYVRAPGSVAWSAIYLGDAGMRTYENLMALGWEYRFDKP